jgi:4-hydroxymandelate oxidase
VPPPPPAPGVEALTDALAERCAASLEPAVYDYYAGGSGREVSLTEARQAWLRYRLRPRVLVDVSTVDTGTTLLGTPLPSPVGLAPMAYQGLLHPGGEVEIVHGTGSHLTVVSTRATRSIEDIAAAAVGPWWFQVYLTADRSLTEALVRRAAAAGAQALVLTGDTPYIAGKARGGRPSGLGTPATMTNFAPHLAPGADAAAATEQNPAATLDDIAWLAGISGLPVLVKGVLRADDARRCLEAGAAGVVVSNHGGRQLDRAVAPALALPEVVEACGDAPVLVDGGARSGLDVLTALALGARAVLVGRPFAWALATGGAAGVAELLGAFDDELAHVLGLAGCPDLSRVGPDLVVRAGT